MEQQAQGALFSSAFEQLVAEHNKALSAGHARLRATASSAERRKAKASLRRSEERFHRLLELCPVPTYATDSAGRITFYNDAAVEFAGRRPQLGTDQWCVTWRLYSPDGQPLPHDQCPMAIAVKENRSVRGARAIAERPDGSRVAFVPYPTPLRDASGALLGAVNMLLDVGDPEPGLLEGAQILVIAGDLFAAAELDLLIDDAGGLAPALVGSLQEALAFLRHHGVDAAVVSPPVHDGQPEVVVAALVERGLPCIVADAGDEQLGPRLLKAIRQVRGPCAPRQTL